MEDYDEDEIDDWRPKSKKKKKGILFSNIVYALQSRVIMLLLFNFTAKPKKPKSNQFSFVTQQKEFAKYKRNVLPKKPLRKSGTSKPSNNDDDVGSNEDIQTTTDIAHDIDTHTQNRRSARLGEIQ